MSNSYRYAYPSVPHYQMPRAVDKWRNSMGVQEFRLLHLIQSEAERTSLSRVPLATDAICAGTGIHRTNIGRVRQALVDYGLLLFEKEGQEFTYIVCDPEKRTAIPDKTNLMKIDFDAPAHVLEKYMQPLIKGMMPTAVGIKGHCPFPRHPDTTASFSMDFGKRIFWCRGCSKTGKLMELETYLSEDPVGRTITPDEAYQRVQKNLRALGQGSASKGRLVKSDIIFSYCDEEGEILTETVRRRGLKAKTVRRRPHPTKPGKYIYNTDGCRNVLFHLPQILEAETVCVLEGEPDCIRLSQFDLKDDTGSPIAVTTCCNGAGSWLPEHSETLRHKRVILCGDTDEAGLKHIQQVKGSLHALGVTLIDIMLPPKYKDISHYLESHRIQEFINMAGEDWLESVEDPEDAPAQI